MRLRPIDSDRVSEDLRPLYEELFRQRGNVPRMFRTAAHRSEVLRTMLAHFRGVMGTGTVPAKLKELLAVRVSQINTCDY